LTKFNSLEKFTISSKPVLVSYIHAGVFVPVYNNPNAAEIFTFSPLSNPSLKLAYWDEEAYVSELLLEVEDLESRADASGDSRERKSQGYAAAEKEGLKKPVKEPEGKTKKRKAETGAGASNKKVTFLPPTSSGSLTCWRTLKAVPAHLQFWYNRHAELHGVKPEEPSTDSTETLPKTVQKTKDNIPAEDAPPVQSFADFNRNCCLLCSRQFKTQTEVNKHERLSQLHRDNMSNDELKAKALAKLAKIVPSSSPPPDNGPQYRDRAKERRSAFNQPTRPTPESNNSKAKMAAEKEVVEAPPPSKGAALLNKMGWTAGAGLGAQGTGVLAPIQTEMYVQGVGLGAAGGKLGDAVEEATRKTRGGYSEFLERTRDKAKERFEGMS
jgi:RNA-binding protein 5/10